MIFYLQGLASDWPSNCQHLPSCTICDPASVARTTARYLRESKKCDLVIALTHMRLAEDIAVSQNTRAGSGRVDLILGGHDHDVVQRSSTDSNNDPRVHRPGLTSGNATEICCTEGDIRIIKSGTDWNGLSMLRLTISKRADGRSSISKSKSKRDKTPFLQYFLISHTHMKPIHTSNSTSDCGPKVPAELCGYTTMSHHHEGYNRRANKNSQTGGKATRHDCCPP